jgi:hypothetical protein
MKQMRRADIPQYRASGSDRLARLADYLENVPPGMLTFTRWYGASRGCAIGLAITYDPWFQAQGLTLVDGGTLKECRPEFEGRSEWRAVVQFFEISLADALGLFTAAGYDGEMRPPARAVAEKVRAHLATVDTGADAGADAEFVTA